MHYPDAARNDIACITWRKILSTSWHEEGREALVTCDVPLSFFLCQLATVSMRESIKDQASSIGILGICPDYESEDPACQPIRANDSDVDEPAADVEPQIPQPRVHIRDGQEDFEWWCRFIDLCPWHILLCFDKHLVVDKNECLEDCIQFIWRLRPITNAKIIVVSYIKYQDSAPRAFEWAQSWSTFLHRCDAIVFVLDQPVHEDGVSVRLHRSTGFRNILMCNGSKGNFLALMGRP